MFPHFSEDQPYPLILVNFTTRIIYFSTNYSGDVSYTLPEPTFQITVCILLLLFSSPLQSFSPFSFSFSLSILSYPTIPSFLQYNHRLLIIVIYLRLLICDKDGDGDSNSDEPIMSTHWLRSDFLTVCLAFPFVCSFVSRAIALNPCPFSVAVFYICSY